MMNKILITSYSNAFPQWLFKFWLSCSSPKQLIVLCNPQNPSRVKSSLEGLHEIYKLEILNGNF